MPSAPGLTPSGERWLHRTMPLSSSTKSARADSPIFSLYAPNFLEMFPFGSKSERTGKLSLRSFANARWDHILSTEMARSSRVELLEFRHDHRVQGQLVRTHWTPIRRIESKNHWLATEVLERYLLIRRTIEREIWRLPPRVENGRTLSHILCYCSVNPLSSVSLQGDRLQNGHILIGKTSNINPANL